MPELTERDVTRDGIAAKLAARRAEAAQQSEAEPKPQAEQELAPVEDEGIESVQTNLFNEAQDEPEAPEIQGEPDDSGEASDVDDSAETIRRLDQLAEIYPEAEYDTLKDLLVEVKVDGEVSEAPLSELIANYQKRQYADKQMAVAAETKKEAAKVIEEKTARLDTQLTEVEDMLEISRQELVGQHESVDWTALRQQDPGEFAALQAEFKQKAEILAQRMGDASKKRQELTLRQQADQAEWQQQQAQAVITMIPGWTNEEQRSKDLEGIVELLKSDSFTDEEIANLHDARYAKYLWEAMQYRKLQNDSPAVKKRLKLAPRQPRKTARTPAPGPSDRVAEAKAGLRKNPRSSRAIADLLKARRTR